LLSAEGKKSKTTRETVFTLVIPATFTLLRNFSTGASDIPFYRSHSVPSVSVNNMDSPFDEAEKKTLVESRKDVVLNIPWEDEADHSTASLVLAGREGRANTPDDGDTSMESDVDVDVEAEDEGQTEAGAAGGTDHTKGTYKRRVHWPCRRWQVHDRRPDNEVDWDGEQADAGKVRARGKGEEQRVVVPLLVHGQLGGGKREGENGRGGEGLFRDKLQALNHP
jgi:hypothetical protein